MIALRYYAVGCFLEPLADLFGVSPSTACDVVAEVSYLIASKRNEFIKLPTDNETLLKKKSLFHRIAGFPLVIFAVDGTFVVVQSFGGNDAETFRNRKTRFSMNVQVAFSADVSIRRIANFRNYNISIKYTMYVLSA